MGDFEAGFSAKNVQETVYNGYVLHSNGHRVSTETTMLELLRSTYPEMHVTRSSPRKCDLIGYAAVGLAEIVKIDNEFYDATRQYVSSGPRIERRDPVLSDNILFAQFQYTWQHQTFILYNIVYTSTYQARIELHFILSPKSVIVEGQTSLTDQLLLKVGAWTAELHDEIFVFDSGEWIKSKELFESVHKSSWNDVILNPQMKEGLISDVQGFFDNQALYKKLAVPWKRGLILHGVPGNGKTISIKALISSLAAREEPVSSLYVKSFDACQGEKYSICSIFAKARKMAPCLLIFEDLDSLVTDKTRSYFLNEVDGLDSNDGILMIGSTNHLEKLDPAISKRPSRFDRKYHFKIPGLEERVAYAQFWRSKLLDSDLVEFPEIICQIVGELSEGFSFAYMKELFVVTLLSVARGTPIDEGLGDIQVSKDSEEVQENIARSANHIGTTNQHASGTAPAAESGNVTPKRQVPKIEIPAHLEDNTLLKILRRELGTLLAEMDSTKDEDWPSEKQSIGGNSISMRSMQGRSIMATMAAS